MRRQGRADRHLVERVGPVEAQIARGDLGRDDGDRPRRVAVGPSERRRVFSPDVERDARAVGREDRALDDRVCLAARRRNQRQADRRPLADALPAELVDPDAQFLLGDDGHAVGVARAREHARLVHRAAQVPLDPEPVLDVDRVAGLGAVLHRLDEAVEEAFEVALLAAHEARVPRELDEVSDRQRLAVGDDRAEDRLARDRVPRLPDPVLHFCCHGVVFSLPFFRFSCSRAAPRHASQGLVTAPEGGRPPPARPPRRASARPRRRARGS